MTQDELKNLLGDDELTSKVSEKIKDKLDKLIVDDGKYIRNENNEYIPRSVLVEEKKKLKEQIDNLTAQVGEMQKNSGDSEKLKEQITKLSDDLKKVNDESDKRLFEVEQASAIREKLLVEGANPDYIDFLMSKVQKDIVQKKDNTWIGLDQVKALKDQQKLFFGTKKVSGEPVKDGEPPEPTSELQTRYNEAIKAFGKSSPQAISVKNEAYRDGVNLNE